MLALRGFERSTEALLSLVHSATGRQVFAFEAEQLRAVPVFAGFILQGESPLEQVRDVLAGRSKALGGASETVGARVNRPGRAPGGKPFAQFSDAIANLLGLTRAQPRNIPALDADTADSWSVGNARMASAIASAACGLRMR